MHDDEMIKIVKVHKQGMYYHISCSNDDTIKFDSEIYFKYNLSVNAIFDEIKFASIIEENCFRICMNTGARLLTQRMHSVYELELKLKKRGFLTKTISAVICECEKMNLLNDEYFTKCYIDELLYKGQGKFKIINSLRKRGISKEIMDIHLKEINDPVAEEERAINAMNKKIKFLAYKKLEPYKLKENLMRHLISKGFSSDIIYKIIDK